MAKFIEIKGTDDQGDTFVNVDQVTFVERRKTDDGVFVYVRYVNGQTHTFEGERGKRLIDRLVTLEPLLGHR